MLPMCALMTKAGFSVGNPERSDDMAVGVLTGLVKCLARFGMARPRHPDQRKLFYGEPLGRCRDQIPGESDRGVSGLRALCGAVR